MASSNSPYLMKPVSNNINMNMGLLSFKLPNSPLNHTTKHAHFNLSISSSPRPFTMQTTVHNHELLIHESSPNGHMTIEEAQTETVNVRFQLHRECSFGQNFLIIGDHPVLGLWDPNNAITLTWSDGHIWTVDIDIPVGECIKFKFIMQESNGMFVWQPGPDRILQTEKSITLCEDWANPDARMVTEMNQEIHFVDPPLTTQGYGVSMEEELVSDEGMPVLVPGLSQLNDEPKPAAGMVSDMAVKDPELNSKGETESNQSQLDSKGETEFNQSQIDSKGDIENTSNSNPRHEIQESCEQVVAEEKDEYQPTTSLLHNDIQWSNNVMQKFLNLFGIQS